MKADIFRIQKDYLPDQAGLYTVVFFNGCPLRCIWCSHPMPDSHPTEIEWDSRDCLYCHLCERNCPTGSLVFKDHVLTYNPDTCSFCRAGFYCTGLFQTNSCRDGFSQAVNTFTIHDLTYHLKNLFQKHLPETLISKTVPDKQVLKVRS